MSNSEREINKNKIINYLTTMLNLFNIKRVNNKTKLGPTDFKYEPIDSNPKRLGLEHNPKIRSTVESDISPTEWCRKQHILLGIKAEGKWVGL